MANDKIIRWRPLALSPQNCIELNNIMFISNSAMQLVTGSPANGGIIIPEHFKVAASATAEKVRRGLCKKIDRVWWVVILILSDKYLVVIKYYGKLWSANLFKSLSILFLLSTATGLTNLQYCLYLPIPLGIDPFRWYGGWRGDATCW